MRIIVVGATGTIGTPLAAALGERHEVVRVGNRNGDYQVDVADQGSIEQLFRSVGPFDALVSLAGEARFKPIGELTEEDFEFSLTHKLMEINLVRAGLAQVREGGSFTLTSGVLSQEPMAGSSVITLVNRGLEGFARAAQDLLCVPPDDRKTQEILDGVTFLFDPACDGSPIPQTPQTLEWGRGSTSFNLAVTRVDNQKPGCTLFYEMQFRIEQPGSPARHLNVLFKASEDLSLGNSRRAVFPIPTSTPLPPQRSALRFALHEPGLSCKAEAIGRFAGIGTFRCLQPRKARFGGWRNIHFCPVLML